MNKGESPFTVPSLKTIISPTALESLKLKLSTLKASAGHQNDGPSMYQKFLEFIIEINQCSNPSLYFQELPKGTSFLEFLKQKNPSNGRLQPIKTMLVYVLQENILDSEDLDCLWRVMRRNTQACSTVIETLSQSPNNDIKEIFIQNVISNILNAPLNQVEYCDYQMLSSMFEICKESNQLFSKQLDSFWQKLSSAATFDLEFDDFLKKMSYLINERTLTVVNKKYLLCTCVENIAKERITLISIKLIRALTESYPPTRNDEIGLAQRSLVQFICKEKDLLNKAIRELESLIVKDNDIKDQKSSQAIDMVQFISFLISSISCGSDIITCNVIVNLWEMGLITGDKDVQGQLFLLIQQIIESKIDKDLDVEDLVISFQEKTRLNKDWNTSRFTKEAFNCFRAIFVVVNQHIQNISEVRLVKSSNQDFLPRFEWLMIAENNTGLEEDGDFLFQVDVPPNKLEGYKILWNLAILADDQSVACKAKDLLAYLYTNLNGALYSQVKEIREEFLSLCFRHLREMPSHEEMSNKQTLMRCLELLHSFIDQTNKDNPKRPKLHSELCKGELLKITVNSTTDITVNSNILVWDLLCKVRALFEVNTLSIYLEEPSSKLIICENQNTRTLADMGIKNNATLAANLRMYPLAFLLQYDKTLHPQVKLIFTKWFENFSDNQKMGPQHFSDFIRTIGYDNWSPNDRSIIEVFAKYDDDKDSYLTLDNFLSFYYDSCNQRPRAVWGDLLANKEAPDLKPPKKKIELSADLNVASLISSNKEYVQVLFSLLESEDDIAVKALQLLNRLPTDPQNFADIVMLKGVRDILHSGSVEPDWSYVLNMNNIYKLFYCLNIVEYLIDTKRLEEDEDESEDVKRLWSQDAALIEYKKSWLSDFVTFGGFEQLNEVVGKLSLFKTSPTIESLITRIKCLIEAIDKVQTLNIMTTATE